MATYQPGYWICDWCPHGRFNSKQECEEHEMNCSCAPPEVVMAKERFKSFWGDYMGPCTTTISKELLKIEQAEQSATSIRQALYLQFYKRRILHKIGNQQD